MSTRPDEATLRELAVRASVDPRSVAKLLRGEPVRGLPGHRIRAVLVAAGLLKAEAADDGARRLGGAT